MYALQTRSISVIRLRTDRHILLKIMKLMPAGNSRFFSTSRKTPRPDSLLATLKNDATVFKNASKEIFYQKYLEAYEFYDQFSRRDEVRLAREKVSAIEVIFFIVFYNNCY